MNNKRFVVPQPTLKMQRSKFDDTIRCYYSAFHGSLIPTRILEMLPGDNIKITVNDFTRMSTPVFPFMGNIKKHHAAFMVPKRILSNKVKQFYGEAEQFGIASPVIEPMTTSTGSSISGSPSSTLPLSTYPNSIGVALGLIRRTDGVINAENITPINMLPIRAFLAVYNEHFRDANFCAPYQWNKDETGIGNRNFASLNGLGVLASANLPKVRKDQDIFTSFLPWAQRGEPVMLPLGGEAPIINKDGADTSDLIAKNTSSSILQSFAAQQVRSTAGTYNPGETKPIETASSSLAVKVSDNVVADLTQATAATISQLLYAMSYQDFLTRLGKYSGRYGDYIRAIFGVNTPDATQDIPEFLGWFSHYINVDTVVQTTGHTSDDDSKLGELGGYSSTLTTNNKLCDYGCTEPGYLVLVTYFKHERIYATGIDDIFLKSELLDYYQTPFANILDTPYSQDLIYFMGDKESSKIKFGFNEPWLGYRTHMDTVRGFLDPNLKGSLAPWTLAEKFENAPILGAEFVEEDRNAIARVLTSGLKGPDYICNTNYNVQWTRVMPVYSSGRIGSF